MGFAACTLLQPSDFFEWRAAANVRYAPLLEVMPVCARFPQRAKSLPVAGKAFANDSVGNVEAADSLDTVERINRHRYRLGDVSIDGLFKGSLKPFPCRYATCACWKSKAPRPRCCCLHLKSVKLSDDRIGILNRTVYFDDIAPSLS
jgi:hypothetical protein